MRVYQLNTAEEFLRRMQDTTPTIELMEEYAKHVATKFSAECVNEALGNKMEVSNSLHIAVDSKYESIIWED